MSRDWNKVLIDEACSIRGALEHINTESLRIALVVDKKMKLLGTVTDGDIRRAILKNVELDAPASTIMNLSPTTASPNLPRLELVKIMQTNELLSIPLVDETGVICGLETLEHALTQKHYDNPVFIMAGGFGTRLRPLTDSCPKPMLKIGDKPILETILASFAKAGFSNIYISTHFMPEIIQDYFGDGERLGVSITYVHEAQPLGTGGALGLLPKDLPKLPLIMINGDVLTTVDFERLLAFHDQHGGAATLCVREYEYQIPYGVINGDGSLVVDMTEKPIQQYYVNAGIYVVDPAVIGTVPPATYIDMPTVLEQVIGGGVDVHMFPIHEYWLDIGKMADFQRAQIDVEGLGL